MFKQIQAYLLASIICLLTACGGGESSKSEPIAAPSIASFSADKTNIMAGESTVLNAVFSNGQGWINKDIGIISASASIIITPDVTTTYTLTVTNSKNVSVTSQLTITVTAPPPEIANFSASKLNVLAGESVELTAIFTGDNAVIDNGVGPISSNAAKSIIPEATATYTLTVTNSAGASVTAQLTIIVIPPEIISFTTSDTNILAGSGVNLTAIFSNGQGTIDTSVGSINSGESKVVFPNNTTTYTLSVENSAGVKVTSTVTVETVPLITSIINPVDGGTFHDYASIYVSIDSQLDLTEVIAELDDRSTSLRRYTDNFYTGGISLTGLTDGEYTLNITGTDSLGRSNNRQKQIHIDNLPVLTITEPNDNALTNPLLPLDISCNDEAGDCLIAVKSNEKLLASATNQLNETIDLSDFINEEITLSIEGKSDEEQVVTEKITVYVASSKINHVKTFSDKIIDFDGQKILLYNDLISEVKQLQIADITNEDVTVIEYNDGLKVDSSKSLLTPTGAIFSVSNAIIYDWNNNELLSLGQTNEIRVAGDFAAYCNSNSLILRSLSEQSNRILDTAHCSNINVSVNGTVVANKDGNVVRYKNQQETLLSPNVSMDSVAKSASISGSFISFYEIMSAFRSARNMLYSDNDNQVIFTGHSLYTGASGDYSGSALNNGWFVYGSGHQLLTRDINGNTLQRTNFSTQSYIESIADNGELVFINEGKRYLSKPNGDLLLVGSSDFGRITYRNGTWYIIIEKSLYELTTP